MVVWPCAGASAGSDEHKFCSLPLGLHYYTGLCGANNDTFYGVPIYCFTSASSRSGRQGEFLIMEDDMAFMAGANGSISTAALLVLFDSSPQAAT